MYELPTSIEIQGTPFRIKENGDFRMVFSCFNVLNDTEYSKTERVLASLILFYEGLDSVDDIGNTDFIEEATRKMFEFFNCGNDLDSNTSSVSLIDWEKDSTLVCSAINNVAKKEIRAEEYLHWWTFMGYYMGIGECPLSTIVGIRYKKAKGKPLEKYEKQFVQDNPQYFAIDTRSSEQKEADAYIRSLWNA